MSAAPKLGILAGGGNAPRFLVEACQKINRPFFIIALEGQADADFNGLPHDRISLGSGAKLKSLIEEQNIKEIVMIGRVRRPSISELKPDWIAVKLMAKIGLNMVGDDALLSRLGKALEDEFGIRIVGAHEVFTELLTPEGLLGQAGLPEDAESDIRRGIEVARALGELDIGQSVIVQQGIVLGVEAIEGTDALIVRSTGLRRDGVGGVLVKIAKPQQDNRFDLPTIGPDTITAVAKAGLRGIVLEAGRSLLLERDKTVAQADAAGVFIVGRNLAAA